MKHISPRLTYLTGFLAVIVLLGVVAYLQAFKGFEPCPLCILQRIALILLGFVFFIGMLIPFKTAGQFLIVLFAILFSTLGGGLAARQIWLQHLPPNQTTGCGASLDYMLQVLPLKDVLQKVLEGTTECSQTGLELFHLSLAGWSLICFSAFTLLSIRQLVYLALSLRERNQSLP